MDPAGVFVGEHSTAEMTKGEECGCTGTVSSKLLKETDIGDQQWNGREPGDWSLFWGLQVYLGGTKRWPEGEALCRVYHRTKDVACHQIPWRTLTKAG